MNQESLFTTGISGMWVALYIVIAATLYLAFVWGYKIYTEARDISNDRLAKSLIGSKWGRAYTCTDPFRTNSFVRKQSLVLGRS